MSSHDGRPLVDGKEKRYNVTVAAGTEGAGVSPFDGGRGAVKEEMEVDFDDKQLSTPEKAPNKDATPRLLSVLNDGLQNNSSLGLNWPSFSPKRTLSNPILPPTKKIKIEKPDDIASLKSVIIKWKKDKIEVLKDNYNNNITEMFYLQNEGNLMDLQSWLKRPSQEYIAFVRRNSLRGDDTLDKRLAAINQAQNAKKEGYLLGHIKSSPNSPSKTISPIKRSPSGSSTPKYSSSPADAKPSQDQIVEKARQEAHVMSRISALRKEGLWGEKRLPKVHEQPRPKAHWDFLLEEMVWLSADFAQERKWKKAAAKKCAKMVQKYFQDKEIQAQKAEKDQELRIRKIAGFIAKEIRVFWGNVEKLLEYKVNTQLDEKKKKALDQQLSFIVDQTEKYSSLLAESMKKPITPSGSTAPSVHSGTISPVSRMSDDDFEPEASSEDDEATIAREEDNLEEQVTELEMLKRESEQTLEDFLNDLPPEYLEKIGGKESENNEDGKSDNVSSKGSDDDKSVCSSVVIKSRRERRIVSKLNITIDSSASTSGVTSDKSSKDSSVGKNSKDQDQDFDADMEDEEDDETTIQEQEKEEDVKDHEKEINDLEEENKMSVEDLIKKYTSLAAEAEPMDEDMMSDTGSTDTEMSDADEDEEDSEDNMSLADLQKKNAKSTVTEEDNEDLDSDEEEEDQDPDEDEDSSGGEQDGETMGLELLMNEDLQETTKSKEEKADKELQNATAVAESLQPKGFTLSSTQVTTPVPFLLKHTLREYQHVGLDWLVTMYEKKLNGILADEMGLGKTIQTISLLAHLACEKGSWGPHLIVVPTSVMLNWEMEFKKWCPAFKILTYYGSIKERKMKRTGWTKPNAFHVCITSYKLVIQDHQSFRRKKWKYFILDEAQNIKNFKSQRWQLLLNFQSQRRLLLTGTPLQNNLMELWSLMHFLMPQVFASHKEFREWFSNPVTGMIEGNKEYNDNIIKRLHKVLRPFILRRLKSEVEQQMPKKFEHVIMCRLSKRQRHLYEEFMSRAKTKETLASGNFLSVINILMQLRKVCNHPNLFEPRPIISPFMMESILYTIPSCVWGVTDYDPFKNIDLYSLNLKLIDLELCLTAFMAHRMRKCFTPAKFIEEIDQAPSPPPKCPAGKIKLHVRPSNHGAANRSQPNIGVGQTRPVGASTSAGTGNVAGPTRIAAVSNLLQTFHGGGVTTQQLGAAGATASGTQNTNQSPNASAWASSGIRFQLIHQGGALKAIPVPVGGSGGMVFQQTPQGPRIVMQQRTATPPAQSATPTSQSGGGFQLVQTSTGHLVLTGAPLARPANQTSSLGISGTAAAALLQKLQNVKGLQGTVITTGAGGRPVLRLPSSTLRPGLPVRNTSVASSVNDSTVSMSNSTSFQLGVSKPLTSVVSTPPKSLVGNVSSNQATTTTTSSVTMPVSSASSSPVKRSDSAKEAEKASQQKKEDRKRSLFHIADLDERRKNRKKDKLSLIARLNKRRCHACPIYGSDLVETLTIIENNSNSRLPISFNNSHWFSGQGLVHTSHIINSKPRNYWSETESLKNIINSPIDHLNRLQDITNHFSFCVPSVLSSSPHLRTYHPPPSKLWEVVHHSVTLSKKLSPLIAPFHSLINGSKTQFPDPRLIQYDCGKLQTLDKLLRRLKSEHHRVLIFTQMTKMLDVFEAFLNYHGHIYLRLDGATRIEQRQVLMERFNQDKRIFVFILSTRSGGIGVNLTGADTVIFYDSDWNPTMDAQAQDRCHRIGQTRDVHIYRLISEQTVEENILKKANQKRLLGDLAIEGGNFTTAFFKKQTINDLFEVDKNEKDASKRMSEVLDKGEKSNTPTPEVDNEKMKMGAFENALAAAEDETDVHATKTARAEAAAELAEFDENIPIDDAEPEEMSKAEHEVAILMKQLTPVEKYAMHFLEACDDGVAAEAVRVAAEIEQQKKDWEIERMRALKEEEERRAIGSDDEMLMYSSADAHNKMWFNFNGRDDMPIWQPPTPPPDENDIYLDSTLYFWYDTSIIPETSLPPVYIKREQKRFKPDPELLPGDSLSTIRGPGQKIRREDSSYAPRSLFDRPSPQVAKMRRDLKLQKSRGILMGKPMEMENIPEWLPHEEHLIQHVIQQVLNLPTNLISLSPAHIPNWDIVADLTNCYARCHRSVRHCRVRYEQKILPREESKASTELCLKKLPRKQKTGVIGKGSPENSTLTPLLASRFETIKNIYIKRAPTTKPMLVNPTIKNPKHAQVLSDSGISYDVPLSPSQVATLRTERIQREKEKQKSQAVELNQQRLQQIVSSQLQIQQQQNQVTQPVQSVAILSTSNNSSTVVSAGQQVIVSTANTSTIKAGTSVVLTQGGSNSSIGGTSTIAVCTSIPVAVTTTNTVISGGNIVGTGPGLLSTIRAAAASSAGSAGTRTALATMQDLQGRPTSQATVVSVASLAQLQAAAKLSQTQQKGTNMHMQTRTLTAHQLNLLRQQALQNRQTYALQQGKTVTTAGTSDQGTIKRVQIAAQPGNTQKIQVAVSGGTVPAITAIQVSQAGRTQLLKSGSMVASSSGGATTVTGSLVTTSKAVTRTVTESEMNALFRRQTQPISKMLGSKRSLVGVKGPTVGLQLGGKTVGSGNVSTVQIVQGGAVHPKHMTFQQVIKTVQPQQIQHIPSGTVVAKAQGTTGIVGSSGSGIVSTGSIGSSQSTTKILPGSVGQQPPIKQTIQVVSAGSTVVGSSGPSAIRVSSGERASSTLATIQGSTVKVTNPALISQVNAALQGQNMPIAVRTPTLSPVRIHTSTLSSQHILQQQQNNQNQQQ